MNTNEARLSEYARSTAYAEDKALEYDAFRFSSEVGKTIHSVERGCLFRALRRVPSGCKVLEIGCGTGRLLKEVSTRGYEVDGADASGPMLTEAAAKFRTENTAGHQPKFALCEASNVPFENDAYDFTYCIRLLNQTESPAYALTVVHEMLRMTKPAGFCLVEFVNDYRPRLGMNRRPTTRLKPREVLAAAQGAGGVAVEWYGAFLFGMQALYLAGDALAPVTARVDRTLARVTPRLCSRVYLLARKRDGR